MKRKESYISPKVECIFISSDQHFLGGSIDNRIGFDEIENDDNMFEEAE